VVGAGTDDGNPGVQVAQRGQPARGSTNQITCDIYGCRVVEVDPVLNIAGNDIAPAGPSQAYRNTGCIVDLHAVGLVAPRSCDGDIRPDVITIDLIVRGVEIDALRTIARDEVARACLRAADCVIESVATNPNHGDARE